MTEVEAHRLLALYEGTYRKFVLIIHPDKVEDNLKADADRALKRLNQANIVVGNRSAPTAKELAERQRAEDRAEEKARRDPV